MTLFEQYLYKIIELDNILNEEYVFDLKVVGDKLYGAIDDLDDSAIQNPLNIAKYKELGEISEFGVEKNPQSGKYYEISIPGIIKIKKLMLSPKMPEGLRFGVQNILDDELAISNVEAEFNIEEADVKKLEAGILRMSNRFNNSRATLLSSFFGEFGNQIIGNSDVIVEVLKEKGFLIGSKDYLKATLEAAIKAFPNIKEFVNELKIINKDFTHGDEIIFNNMNKDKVTKKVFTNEEIKKILSEIIKIPAKPLMIVKRKTNMVKPISKN